MQGKYQSVIAKDARKAWLAECRDADREINFEIQKESREKAERKSNKNHKKEKKDGKI